MKKIISIILVLAFAVSLGTVSVFAEGENVKNYNTTLTIGTDGSVAAGGSDVVMVDLNRYELAAQGTLFEQSNLVLTKPGFAIGYFVCRNEDQSSGDKIPMPFSLNYEVTIAQQRYEADGVTKIDEFAARDVERNWLDNGNPGFVKPGGGDYEWAYLQVTQEMIDAAGGSFEVVFMARATIYPDTPVSELGQVFNETYVHVYEEKSTDGNTHYLDLSGTHMSVTNTEVYKVDVTWGSMEFTYTDSVAGEWDPESHSYVNSVPASWTCDEDANKITVANHSNAAVTVSLTSSLNTGITGEFKNEENQAVTSLSLATAEGTEVATAPTASAFFNITGGSVAETGKIGTITVQLG